MSLLGNLFNFSKNKNKGKGKEGEKKTPTKEEIKNKKVCRLLSRTLEFLKMEQLKQSQIIIQERII